MISVISYRIIINTISVLSYQAAKLETKRNRLVSQDSAFVRPFISESCEIYVCRDVS